MQTLYKKPPQKNFSAAVRNAVILFSGSGGNSFFLTEELLYTLNDNYDTQSQNQHSKYQLEAGTPCGQHACTIYHSGHAGNPSISAIDQTGSELPDGHGQCGEGYSDHHDHGNPQHEALALGALQEHCASYQCGQQLVGGIKQRPNGSITSYTLQ